MINDLQAIAKDIAELKTAILHTKTVFTPEQAADYMDIALSTLYKLTSAGILPFSKPNGKLIYFSRIELDTWLLSNNNKSGEKKDIQAATYISLGGNNTVNEIETKIDALLKSKKKGG